MQKFHSLPNNRRQGTPIKIIVKPCTLGVILDDHDFRSKMLKRLALNYQEIDVFERLLFSSSQQIERSR